MSNKTLSNIPTVATQIEHIKGKIKKNRRTKQTRTKPKQKHTCAKIERNQFLIRSKKQKQSVKESSQNKDTNRHKQRQKQPKTKTQKD